VFARVILNALKAGKWIIPSCMTENQIRDTEENACSEDRQVKSAKQNVPVFVVEIRKQCQRPQRQNPVSTLFDEKREKQK
jgi:hypothetical protein